MSVVLESETPPGKGLVGNKRFLSYRHGNIMLPQTGIGLITFTMKDLAQEMLQANPVMSLDDFLQSELDSHQQAELGKAMSIKHHFHGMKLADEAFVKTYEIKDRASNLPGITIDRIIPRTAQNTVWQATIFQVSAHFNRYFEATNQPKKIGNDSRSSSEYRCSFLQDESNRAHLEQIYQYFDQATQILLSSTGKTLAHDYRRAFDSHHIEDQSTKPEYPSEEPRIRLLAFLKSSLRGHFPGLNQFTNTVF